MVLKGQIGETLTKIERALRGERVVGSQINFLGGGAKARFDLLTRNVFTRKLRVVESKFGLGARLERGQPIVARTIRRTGASVVRGSKSVRTLRSLGFKGGSIRRGLTVDELTFVEQRFPLLERIVSKLF